MSLYAWLYRRCGPNGFGYSSTAEEVTEGIDLSGKTALVTGVNSGLGVETARVLQMRGAHIIAVARTLEKAEGARQALAQRVGSDPFETLEIDVSTIESAKAAGDELVRRGNSIDTLLLNAGMISGEVMNKSADGIEVDIPNKATVKDLMTKLGLPGSETYLVIVNDGTVPKAKRAEHNLSDGDRVAIVPPLKGG